MTTPLRTAPGSAGTLSGSRDRRELHPYAARVLGDLRGRLPWEIEFLQAVEEVFEAITPVLVQHPHYESERILERIVEPERAVGFRVVWTDDRGRVQVNRGFRVQFNSALGPYKGGTRFHPSVDLGSLKFLGFEQMFKNSLTGLPLGGGKGGADLSVRGLTAGEMMRFCQSYMTELYRHIGAEIDVPAGDIGVGTREIGYLFGQYKRLTGHFDGTLTGKGLSWGGSLLRPEATGFGLAYFTQEMLHAHGESFTGKTVAVSGFGNVAWGAVKKVTELGGKVVTLSGPDGFVYDKDGVKDEKIDFMLDMRSSGRDAVEAYAERFGASFHAGRRPWGVPCDIALPCAIQNDVDVEDAATLIANGCSAVVEGANMPTRSDAIHLLQKSGVLFAPGKASNAGGVAMSGLEMSQNHVGLRRSADDLDANLRSIMANIHRACMETSGRFGAPGDYVAGANISGFTNVADAMLDQGAV